MSWYNRTRCTMDNILVVSSWILLTYLSICLNVVLSAEYKFDVTVFDNSPRVGSSSSEQYRVYVPPNRFDVNFDKVGRWRDTGTGEVGTGYSNPFDGGRAPDGSGLPTGSTVVETQKTIWKKIDVNFLESSSDHRVGVFYATTTRSGQTLTIPIIKISETATVKPSEYTKTIGIGDSVMLTVDTTDTSNLRWVLNNGAIITAWNGRSEVNIDNARLADGGIYECFEDGKRETGKHAIMRLIVRECPSNKYGPDCSNNCTTCWNGGICAADNGICLCQPGFRGEHCQERLGNNNWGALGTLYCSGGSGNCRTALICGPDPIGCSCVAGYTGLNCTTVCPNGWYGSSCKRQCHCDTGNCISDKGCALGASCTDGYSEQFCQGKLVCDDSSFGAQCEFPCHCEGGGDCNKTTGECDSGVCAYGWGGVDCQQALPYFYDVKAANANASGTTIDITWNAWNQSIDYGTGPVKYYKIYWKANSSDTDVFNETSPHPFVRISDLDPETLYTFEIAPVKQVSGIDLEGPKTVGTSATTGCGAPVLEPTITEVTQIAEDRAMLKWMIPGGFDWTQCSQGLNGFVILQRSGNMTATIRVNDPTLISFEIDSLSPCSRHEFSIKATNKDAEGNLSSTENVTIFVKPEKIKDISYTEITTDGVLEWSEPASLCELLDYVVNVDLINSDQCDEKTETIIADHHDEKTLVALPLLQYFSTYVATIQARSGSNNFSIGEPAKMEFTTEESVPSGAPTIIAVDSQSSSILWEPPACRSRHGNITIYEYEYWFAGGSNVSIDSRSNTTDTTLGSLGLSNDNGRMFHVRAYTNKGPGPFSENELIARGSTESRTEIAGVVVGILIVLLIVVVILLIVIYRKRRSIDRVESKNIKETQRSKQQRTEYENVGYIDNNVTISEVNSPASDIPPIPPRPDVDTTVNNVPSFSRSKPVDLKDFMLYVKVKKTGGPNHELKKDFEDLPQVDDETFPWTVAKKPENKTKNRYKNIVTYDHSRVILEKVNNDEHSDYINASYIDGYKKKNAYIGSQGPNSSTVKDMWQMIWQENVENIIMVTGLQEGIKIKCEQYWPNVGKSASYGDYTVTNSKEEDMGFYAVRYLNLIKTEIYANQVADARVIRQFHYTGWPDMGLPEFAEPVLKYLEHVNSCISPSAGPVVVHCSAGIGRTGTFIAIDAMLKMARAEGRVNVFNFVKEMRHSRPGMIQTEYQYTFVHDALLEALFCGETTLPTSEVDKAWHAVELAKNGQENHIRAQFKTLTSMFPPLSKMEYAVGNLPENRSKIRNSKYIPTDSARPKLSTPGENSNTFINAGFCHGHGKSNMYLTTQAPMPNTVNDFWTMMFDYELKTIVTLYTPSERDETYGTYFPSQGSLECGQFVVEATNNVQKGNTIETTLRLFKTDNSMYMNTPVEIQLIQYTEWQSDATFPSSASSLVLLLDRVNAHRRGIKDKRIVVIDRDGVSRCGMFCAVMSIIDQIKEQQQVDVFRAVKRLKVSRREMINTMEQYTFCYEAARAYLQSFETYSNFQ